MLEQLYYCYPPPYFNNLTDYRNVEPNEHPVVSRRAYAKETPATTTRSYTTKAHYVGTIGEPGLARGDPDRG